MIIDLLQFLNVCFRFKNIAAKSKDDLVSLGFPQFTIEDFHDTVSIWDIKHVGLTHNTIQSVTED